jgi:glucose-6-phosphate isomerase, archaeal
MYYNVYNNHNVTSRTFQIVMIDLTHALPFDRHAATLPGHAPVERTLSQLRGVFADETAYDALLAEGDPLVYSVASVEPDNGDGQLHYGIGKIMAGRVGDEYFLTRGHLHQWRPAAEIYIGLSGVGIMLLEDERTGAAYSVDLVPDSVVYVPGYTAHRTVNTGDMPLTYFGIYPAQAGHDYGALAERNFAQVVVAKEGKPQVLDRQAFLAAMLAVK